MFGLVRPTTDVARAPQRGLQRPSARSWDPWSEMNRIREEMDSFVTQAFGLTPLNRMFEGGANAGVLPVELYETAEQYQLRAHLPGLAREDINLEATAHKITLWGERRYQAPPEGTKVHFSTAGYGSFRFEYELPLEIKADEVQASYRDGVLEVLLPKVEVSKPEVVKVAIEG